MPAPAQLHSFSCRLHLDWGIGRSALLTAFSCSADRWPHPAPPHSRSHRAVTAPRPHKAPLGWHADLRSWPRQGAGGREHAGTDGRWREADQARSYHSAAASSTGGGRLPTPAPPAAAAGAQAVGSCCGRPALISLQSEFHVLDPTQSHHSTPSVPPAPVARPACLQRMGRLPAPLQPATLVAAAAAAGGAAARAPEPGEPAAAAAPPAPAPAQAAPAASPLQGAKVAFYVLLWWV